MPDDWTPLNVWQMRNCAACGKPDPCPARALYLADFEQHGVSAIAVDCPQKVAL